MMSLSRRRFGASLAASAAGAALASMAHASKPSSVSTDNDNLCRFRFAVKWGMIEIDGPPLNRFRLCRELGYDGMELISPGQPSTNELLSASTETGLPVHGLVNERHWQLRLSSPEVAVRDQGRAILEQAIRDCAALRGHTVLLVPGVVGPEATHDQVWSRSLAEIRKVLPLCSTHGVRVLIENVWNGFCETPETYRDYLDAIGSPWVGAYLDLGNCRKFGPTEDWVRTLGPRIVKLDVKDWGAAKGFCKIGEGDVDWPAVRTALAEIGYSGWCTAEVTGGGRDRLADIHQRMTNALYG
ncbi:sugar phosphate isomerase/epimerase family protein [Botrimarina hoheduenensis]|nr:sugar phosphate isomerase/epimerase family protein [Botrimarina hoheduenensis]